MFRSMACRRNTRQPQCRNRSGGTPSGPCCCSVRGDISEPVPEQAALEETGLAGAAAAVVAMEAAEALPQVAPGCHQPSRCCYGSRAAVRARANSQTHLSSQPAPTATLHSVGWRNTSSRNHQPSRTRRKSHSRPYPSRTGCATRWLARSGASRSARTRRWCRLSSAAVA